MIKYVILIPSFNDWECLNLLIPKINQILKNTNEEVDILIVNDGSTDNTEKCIDDFDIFLKFYTHQKNFLGIF